MCRIAQNDGTMRYGLRASKLATLCEYSVATIHRAERYLLEHGYIERVRRGGGRVSTHWRIVVEKLAPPSPSHAPAAPAPSPNDTPTAPPRPSRWSWPKSRPPQSTIVTSICDEHGGDGSTLADGTPRCPQCRTRRGTMRRQ
jgi:DNA-binding transcriptional MocR family regulator